MHGAPSVSYPVGRSRFAGAALLLAWAAGAAGVATWRWQTDAAPAALVLAVAAVLLTGAFALRSWRRSPHGVLAWDGNAWTWASSAGTEAGEPETVLDLQRWVLVRWSPGVGTRWLWLERDGQPAAWDALRRALYSRARPAGQRTAPGGAARP